MVESKRGESAGVRLWNRYDTVVGAMLVVLLLFFTFPVFGWFANSADPIILGMPFSMFWIVLWTVVELLLLAWLYRLEYAGRDES